MRRFFKNTLLVLCSVLCVAAALCGVCVNLEAKAAENDISATVKSMEMLASDKTAILYFSETDYITAAFDENDDTAARYKWVDSLTYEDRANYNVHNALLDKNAESYNYQENIFIDGEALSNYPHQLVANRFQRIQGLGLTFEGDVLSNATEILLKAGCAFPTLEGGYFGVSQKAIVLEEDTVFRKRNGDWVRGYVFEGYEANVVYDASEEFFYKRSADGSYKGHTEAPTCEFSIHYQAVGDDMALASAKNTDKGNLFVLDFVNPIDTSVFGTINLRFYVHEPRTMATYNASGVTEASLGEKVEDVTAGVGWSVVSLMAPLYADENGMVETLVFQFTNDGDLVNSERNYVAIGEFSLGAEQVKDLIYDKSLMIAETETAYELIFRFNKKGEFTSDVLDLSKFCINGESLEKINALGNYVSAKWTTIQGVYQINVTLSKSYNGDGQIKNADIGYACNKITVLEGLPFPNGELLDRTYNYNLFRNFTDSLMFENEVVIDYESGETFQETKVKEISWQFEEAANNNIHLYILFDKKITSKAFYHVCEAESWRENVLVPGITYDPIFTSAFLAGGYKSSLLNSVVINGKTIGEWHASNNYQTCIYVNYGQSSFYTLDVCIDKNASDYAELAALFESGEGVKIELKEGFKFTTGVRTESDHVFVLKNGSFVNVDKEPISVFFDGIEVKDGDVLEVDYKALSSSIYVEGAEEYEVSETEDGDVKTFTVTVSDGTTVSFQVKQTVVTAPDSEEEDGCGSSLAAGAFGIFAAAGCAALLVRRKRDEE